MQAAILPALGALGGGSAAIGAATLASAAGPIMGGLSARAQAKAQARQEVINARISGIRALQTETAARAGLESEMASIQSAMAASGSTANVAATEFLNENRAIRDREIRIGVSNELQRRDDSLRSARDSRRAGNVALISGFAKGFPSMFDLYNNLGQG